MSHPRCKVADKGKGPPLFCPEKFKVQSPRSKGRAAGGARPTPKSRDGNGSTQESPGFPKAGGAALSRPTRLKKSCVEPPPPAVLAPAPHLFWFQSSPLGKGYSAKLRLAPNSEVCPVFFTYHGRNRPPAAMKIFCRGGVTPPLRVNFHGKTENWRGSCKSFFVNLNEVKDLNLLKIQDSSLRSE